MVKGNKRPAECHQHPTSRTSTRFLIEGIKRMNPSKVPLSADVSNPVPTESQALVEDARRLMATRKARSAQTLTAHKQSRTAHKARSRALVEDAGRRSFDRFVQARYDRQVDQERDVESRHYDSLTEQQRPAERRVA